MRIAISIQDDKPSVTRGAAVAGLDDLRRWLTNRPALRGRISGSPEATSQPAGAMGTGTDVILALLEPGGVATVLTGAVIAWLQTRRGSQTVTISRPDGTRITVSSDQVRAMDGQQAGTLAQEIATTLGPSMPESKNQAVEEPEVTTSAAQIGEADADESERSGR